MHPSPSLERGPAKEKSGLSHRCYMLFSPSRTGSSSCSISEDSFAWDSLPIPPLGPVPHNTMARHLPLPEIQSSPRHRHWGFIDHSESWDKQYFWPHGWFSGTFRPYHCLLHHWSAHMRYQYEGHVIIFEFTLTLWYYADIMVCLHQFNEEAHDLDNRLGHMETKMWKENDQEEDITWLNAK